MNRMYVYIIHLNLGILENVQNIINVSENKIRKDTDELKNKAKLRVLDWKQSPVKPSQLMSRITCNFANELTDNPSWRHL
jgi:hypothetical protein